MPPLLEAGTTANNLTALPNPSSMTVIVQDVDASTTTRTADGTMHRDRIAGGSSAKRKIELRWAYPNTATVRQVLQAIQHEFFYLRYDDPFTGAKRTAQFYSGDRKMPMYNHNLYGTGIRWEELSANLIEK